MFIKEAEKKYLTANGQSTYLWYPNDAKRKIFLNLSGGTDSSMLLWQYLKYFRERNIFPKKITALTGVDMHRPTSEWNATEIFLAISEQFPEQNLYQEIFRYYKEGEKRKYHIEYENILRDQRNYTVTIHGKTANPPEENQKQISGMWEDISRPSEREHTNLNKADMFRITKEGKINSYYLSPWNRIDKKFIAGLYDQEKFMKDNIFQITASCISNNPKDTEYWSKPCKKCWWCKEKYWAFGCYDNGEL